MSWVNKNKGNNNIEGTRQITSVTSVEGGLMPVVWLTKKKKKKNNRLH